MSPSFVTGSEVESDVDIRRAASRGVVRRGRRRGARAGAGVRPEGRRTPPSRAAGRAGREVRAGARWCVGEYWGRSRGYRGCGPRAGGGVRRSAGAPREPGAVRRRNRARSPGGAGRRGAEPRTGRRGAWEPVNRPVRSNPTPDRSTSWERARGGPGSDAGSDLGYPARTGTTRPGVPEPGETNHPIVSTTSGTGPARGADLRRRGPRQPVREPVRTTRPTAPPVATAAGAVAGHPRPSIRTALSLRIIGRTSGFISRVSKSARHRSGVMTG